MRVDAQYAPYVRECVDTGKGKDTVLLGSFATHVTVRDTLVGQYGLVR